MNRDSRRQERNIEGREIFAKSIGLLSIGLGVAHLVAPNHLARLIGVRNRPAIFAALGVREIISGIGILAQRRPAGWLWSRVAGDVMDLSLLGAAFGDPKSDRTRVEATAAAVGGVLLADAVCALQHTGDRRPIRVQKVITIERPPEELYSFWRRFENLPRFMRNLDEVRSIGQNRSHWTVVGPAGTRVEWEAEIVDDRPNELISWRSLPGADVDNSGSVRFERAPAGRATFVRVKMEYNPPGGLFGASVAKLFGDDPEMLVQRDLYRFKQVMETGQVGTTDAQPSSTATRA
jgi:uncharacterized membrane protein